MSVAGSRVAVVGGSIAGCATAIALGRAGCDVAVLERSSTGLRDRGAGQVAQEEGPDRADAVEAGVDLEGRLEVGPALAGHVEQVVDLHLAIHGRFAAQAERDVVGDGQVRKQVKVLKHHTDLLRRILQSADFMAGRVDTGIVDRLTGEK